MSKVALLIVDVQNDFLPKGSLPTVEKGVVQATNTLLRKGQFDIVVASQDWHPQAHVSFAASHGRASGETVKVDGTTYNLFEQHCIQGTFGAQFASDLDTSRFDTVIRKGTDKDEDCFSVFCSFGKRQSTGLADWLRQKDVSHVYVAGVALETCVKHTVEDALQLGFGVSLVHNACAPVEADAERDIWQDLQAAGCNMTTVAEVCEASST